MTYTEKKEQARQMAIDWQNEQAKKSSYYAEQFRKLAKRYGLTREFLENGII